jgi:hypothetical protein
MGKMPTKTRCSNTKTNHKPQAIILKTKNKASDGIINVSRITRINHGENFISGNGKSYFLHKTSYFFLNLKNVRLAAWATSLTRLLCPQSSSYMRADELQTNLSHFSSQHEVNVGIFG